MTTTRVARLHRLLTSRSHPRAARGLEMLSQYGTSDEWVYGTPFGATVTEWTDVVTVEIPLPRAAQS